MQTERYNHDAGEYCYDDVLVVAAAVVLIPITSASIPSSPKCSQAEIKAIHP